MERTQSTMSRIGRNLTDLLTRAGAVNLANLARKGLRFGPTGWAIA